MSAKALLLTSLLLCSCQAASGPGGSGTTSLRTQVAVSAADYSRLAAEAQRAMIRSTLQGALSTPGMLMPSGSERQAGESRLMALVKDLMAQVADRFAAIVPPAEYRARHDEMVAFFRLNASLFQETLATPTEQTLTQQLTAVLVKRGLSETAFREQGQRIKVLLEELRLVGLRSELAARQRGPALSEIDYDTRAAALLRELEADIGNSGALLVLAANKQSLISLRDRVRTNADSIAGLGVPPSRQQHQLKLYGLAVAGREVADTLYRLAEQTEFAAVPNPLLMLNADMLVAMSLWSQAKKALRDEPED